ncbi:MAG: Fe-S cluster assembly protein SufB [Candidatus Curtissbacteria bacterium]|nr:Fe-S cluster assembly protein SufB [Candidatus Curtissbacteria bacterium]
MANGIVIPNDYKYGFSKPENYVFKAKKGLSKDLVEQISEMKNEPEWMREQRLRALEIFLAKKMPKWGADLSNIDFDDIFYYIKPIDSQKNSWNDLPKEIKETYDAIGIPEAERKLLAGVTAQYESESDYHTFKKKWEDRGVIFCDMDTGLREHGDFVREYFGKAIPPADNKFAALNSAAWSGGSFIYVPKGVSVDIPLQAYFRINAANMGQFERTLIIVDEGAYVHYVEGCFIAGARVRTDVGEKQIEDIAVGDKVLTHKGRYRSVYRTMKRPYKGKVFSIKYWGDSKSTLQVTEEHPLLVCRREVKEYRNINFTPEWLRADQVEEGDYLVYPIHKKETEKEIIEKETVKTVLLRDEKPFIYNYKPSVSLQIPFGNGIHVTQRSLDISLDSDFYRLVGYYLAEGHVDNDHYLTFTFNIKEKNLLNDVKVLLIRYFGKEALEGKVRNSGQTLTLCSTLAARFFRREFGSTNRTKHIPGWMLESPKPHLKELIKGLWLGDGSYDVKANMFRYNSVTRPLVYGFRDTLLKLGVVVSINSQKRLPPKKIMYTVIISRTSNTLFGQIVGKSATDGRKEGSPFYIDENYVYLPIKSIKVEDLNTDVYNFSVEEDESYVAEGVVSHNCTAPVYTTDSLHAAVVEIFVKRGARCRYTTIQNWSNNVYNLVTKRAFVDEDGTMEWVDGNLGSKITMKYPSCYLRGKGARGEILSLALAGDGQIQDAGGKLVFLASDTSGEIISKSISHKGGRTSYRGLVKVIKGAQRVKCNVRCDALILDDKSRSDTYPTMKVDEDNVRMSHEASVSKIDADKLFYLMSRGLSEVEATSLIVNGFIEPIVKELPLEYAVELNRLIQLNMEGAVG